MGIVRVWSNYNLQSVVKLTRYTVTAVSGGTYSLF